MTSVTPLLLCLVGGLAPGAAPPVPPKKAAPAVLDVRNLPNADKGLKERLVRADAAARKLLGPKLHEQSYRGSPPPAAPTQSTRFRLFWDGTKLAGKPQADEVGRRLDIECVQDLTNGRGPLQSLRMWANWVPQGESWKAYVVYTYTLPLDGKGPGWVGFQLMLDHPKHARSPLGPPQSVGLPLRYLVVPKKYGPHEYDVGVRDLAPWRNGGVASAEDAEPFIRRLFASAESFRDAALEDLDRMEKAVRAGVAGGEAVLQYPAGEPSKNGLPPKGPRQSGPPGKPTHPLTAEQKKAALQDLLDHIEHHRRLVRAHFRDMHGAARRAFPLDEVVGKAGKE